jgi:ABC-2 type transport system ATP-binding protein
VNILNDAILRCEKLTKIYRVFPNRTIYALRDLDLEVPRGIIFSIIGPNGSGKTTLFKILMGFIQRFSGRFVMNGSENAQDLSSKEGIGFLPENPSLYPDLNAFDTLRFCASFFRKRELCSRDNIERLIELVGLKEHARKKVREYSKGMIQRLSIAQSLINDPELLIMDELTSGLDPFVTEDINAIILRLKDRGKTIILSSHLLGHIQDISDVIAIFFRGRLLQKGSLRDITRAADRGIAVFETGGRPIEECQRALLSCGIKVTSVDYMATSLEESFKAIVNREKNI